MKNFNKLFDHTILKPPTTEEELKKVCDDAIKYGFCSVAVNTGMVKSCAEFLKDSDVLVDAAVGFPLGITTVEVKAFEAEQAIKNGAGEIDYVINIGKMKQGDLDYIKKEMEILVSLCNRYDVTSKVIFENCYLTDDEKIKLCEIAKEVKPDFIKTSTGFAKNGVGATVEKIKMLSSLVKPYGLKVKASGGIKTKEDALSLIEAGADTLGTSSGCEIVK